MHEIIKIFLMGFGLQFLSSINLIIGLPQSLRGSTGRMQFLSILLLVLAILFIANILIKEKAFNQENTTILIELLIFFSGFYISYFVTVFFCKKLHGKKVML